MGTPFYFTDTQNLVIRKVDATGNISSLALTSSDPIYVDQEGFVEPWGMTIDAAGNLYVCDTAIRTIYKIDTSLNVTAIAGTGSLGQDGDGGPATAARLGNPYYVAFDAAGNLYHTENAGIRAINMQSTTQSLLGVSIAPGNIDRVVGDYTPDYGGDGGAATSAQISGPYGLTFDASGNLYFADGDTPASVIRKVSPSGTISGVAGNSTFGFSGDGGPAASAVLDRPLGVAFDQAGNLYIADTSNHRIRVVNMQGTTQTILGVAIASGDIQTVAGTGVQGFSGDGGPGTVAELNTPWFTKVDPSGNLLICDTNNHRIRQVDASTGVITTIVGTGANAYTGDGGPASSAAISLPFAIALVPEIEECCPPAIPPDGPFDDFTEQDIFTFFPGNALRASTLDKLNRNILEATLSPEFFPPAIYHDGDIVPLPVSGVDGYAYTRPELTYLWSWNNTGPESEIRLPTFSGFVYTDTAGGHVPGQVHTDVWRLPAGHPPLETHEGSLRVIVIGSRQAQHLEILDDGTNPPDDGGNPADSLSGSLVFTDLVAALPPTVLETIPAGRSGLVQITYTAKITRVASTSSVLGGATGAQVSYADANDLQEVQTSPGPTDAGNLLTTVINGTINVNASENNDVIFQFDYTSVGATAMTYTLNIAWQAV